MLGKTRVRSTAQQIKLLTDFMATHPNLAYPKFTGPQSASWEKRQWESLRVMLREHGPDKSVEQWKVSWRDLRRKARTDRSIANGSFNRTGNDTGLEGTFGIDGYEESGEEVKEEIITYDEEASQHTTSEEESGPLPSLTNQTEPTANEAIRRTIRQRQQEPRARANQVLQVEVETNNVMKEHTRSKMLRKSRVRSTTQQIKLLTDFMATHPSLARGEFPGPQGKLREQRQWKHLRIFLKEHGPDKSIDQWKVTWRDLRRKALTEVSIANSGLNRTENTTVVPELSDNTKKILDILGPEEAFGIFGGEESGIGLISSVSSISVDQSQEMLKEEIITNDEEDESTNESQRNDHNYASQHNTSEEVSGLPTLTDRTEPTGNEANRRTIRQRQQEPRASANQFLQVEVNTNNILKVHTIGRRMLVKTRIRSTPQQINLLTDFMATHPTLARGKFTGRQGKMREQRQWKHLRIVLKEHGPDKSIDQWKATWRDLRRKALTEGSIANSALSSNGNATIVPELSDNTKKILAIMESEGALGIDGGEESGIGVISSVGSIGVGQSQEVVKEEIITNDEEDESTNESQRNDHNYASQHNTTEEASEPLPTLTNQTEPTANEANRKTIRQRQQEPRARANQVLQVEVETNNVLKEHTGSRMLRKSRIRSTPQQIKLLTNFMATHPALARGEFTGFQGSLRLQRQWKHLRMMLKEHGPDKSVDQWKVTWRALRRKARNYGKIANRASNRTAVPELLNNTKKILGIIKSERAFGMGGGEESGIGSTSSVGTINVGQSQKGMKEEIITYDEEDDSTNESQRSAHHYEASQHTTSEEASGPLATLAIQTEPTGNEAIINQRIGLVGRAIRQRQQEPSARSNQFLQAELERNNILKDIAHQLVMANRYSAIHSRIIFKERLWQLRRDLFD